MNKSNPIDYLRPNILASFIVTIGLFSTLIPKNYYKYLLGEDNMSFLNINMYAVVMICLASFIIGGKLIKQGESAAYQYSSDSTLIIFFIGTIFAILRLYDIITSLSPSFVIEAIFGDFTNRQFLLRGAVSAVFQNSSLGWVKGLSFTVIAYGWYVIINKNINIRSYKGLISLIMVCIITASYLIEALILQGRGAIFEIVVAILLSYIAANASSSSFNWLRTIQIGLRAIVIFIGIFIAISVRRSMIDQSKPLLESIMYLVVGYFASAYNRLAFILDGSLVVVNAGTFYNSLLNIVSPPFSNQFTFLKIGEILNLTPPVSGTDAWIESFSAVASAGLNPAFNWFTVFGIVYSDFGNITPIYFLIYGALSKYAWLQYKKCSFIGLTLYPWIVLSIFAWWGAENVYIAKRETVMILLIGVFYYFMSTYINVINPRLRRRPN